MYSTARVRTRTTRQTPRQLGGPRCCARPRLGLAFQSIEDQLLGSIVNVRYMSCCISARAFSNSSWPHKPPSQNPTQSKEANVFTGSSSLCGQFGDIRAQEPFLPLKVNRGPAAIHRSGQTDIRLRRAVRGPLPRP